MDPHTPYPDEGLGRRRTVFVAALLVAVVAAMVAFRAVLLPFVMGALLAYLLHPVVGWLTRQRVAGRSMPRWGAVLVIYVVMLSSMVAGIQATAPRLVRETRDFVVHEVPALRQRAETTWLPRVRLWAERGLSILNRMGAQPAAPAAEDRPVDNTMRVEPLPEGGYRVVLPEGGVEVERVSESRYRVVPARPRREREHDERAALARQLRTLGEGRAADLLRAGGGLVGGIIGGIFRFFMTLMVSAYILVTEDRIYAFVRSLVRPRSRASFDDLLYRLDRGLAGVVRGQLIICFVNGLLSAVGFAIAGLKYWPILALVAGVMSLIPIFGSILSSIPAVAVGLTQSFGTGLFVLVWILGIHQLEANLLNPKIMGDAAKIHPVLVVFALLVGEHFFGILGALLAVPTLSIIQTLFLHWRRYALGPDELAPESIVPPRP